MTDRRSGERDIPELYLTNFDFKLRLDDTGQFTDQSFDEFLQLSVNDKQKLLFRLPIPVVEHTISSQSRSNTSTSSSGTGSPKSETGESRSKSSLLKVNLANLIPHFKKTPGSFEIDGRKFTYKFSSHEHVNQFLTPIWKKNQLSEDQFFEKYVYPYLHKPEPVDYESLYPRKLWVRLLNPYQMGSLVTSNEREVENVLLRCLYDPIGQPLLKSLADCAFEANDGSGVYLNDKGVEIKSALDLETPLIPFFNSMGASDLKMLGVSVVPDCCVGYTFDPLSRRLATLVGFIEVKSPDFAIQESYDKLCGDLPDPKINFDHLGISFLEGKTLKFLKTVRKACTMCVHTGCDRFMIVDYDSYLFVHLDSSVSLLPEDQEKESQEKRNPFAENDPEEGSSSRMTATSIAGKNEPKNSNTLRSLSQYSVPQMSERDINNSKNRIKIPLHLISSRHFCVSRKHPHVRLFVLAFLSMSKERWNEIRSFREKVIKIMNSERETNEKRAERKRARQEFSNKDSVAKRLKTTVRRTGGGASGGTSKTLSSTDDSSYRFDKDVFEDEYEIDFGPIRHSLLRVATYMNSQVISVYSKKFIEKLSPIHPIFHKAIPKDIPDISVLKIFDPQWGMELYDGEDYTYPDGIAMCTHELKVYEKLKNLMGSYVPWIFTYGRTVDIHVSVGQMYPRFWGGFIQMEHIEPDRTFAEDISKDFVLNSIIPAYETLHKCGVVQNDFKLSNLIITKDHHQVKIIDFSAAIITNDENLFKEEIRDIKRYFNIPI